MTLNTSQVVGNAAAADAKEGYDKHKAQAVREAGFDPASLRPEAYEHKLNALRFALIEAAALKAGFAKAEVALMAEGRTVLGEAEFKAALRRIRAGARMLPSRFVSLVNDAKLVRFGEATKVMKMAFGDLAKVDPSKLAAKILDDNVSVLFNNEYQLKETKASWERNKLPVARLMAAAWTPERLILRAAIETGYTAEKLATLLPGAKLDERDPNKVLVTYGYAEVAFDFGAGYIADLKLLKQLVCMGTELDHATVLGLIALSLVDVTRQGSAEAKIRANAPSIYEEPETGYGVRKDNSRHEARIKNRLGIIAVTANSMACLRFQISDKRGWEDVVDGAQIYLDRDLPVTFDGKIGSAFVGDGALAMLVGRRGDDIKKGTDASKPGKLFSRTKLAAHAIAETVDTGGKSTIEPSGLQVLMSDGSFAMDYGTRFERVWLTNATTGPGSGVAIGLPGDAKRIRLIKTVANDIIVLGVPGAVTDTKLPPAVQLEKYVSERLELNHGLIRHRDTVFALNGIPYGVWDGDGMTCRIVGKPSIAANPNSDSVKVSVKVAAEFEYTANKLTADGVKLTVVEYPVKLTSATGAGIPQPNLILTKEEIKGDVAVLRLWADDVKKDLDMALANGWVTPVDHAAGGPVYDPNAGLSEAQTACLSTWRDVHSFIVHLEIEVDDDTYRIQKGLVDTAKTDSEFAAREGIDPTAYAFVGGNTIIQTIEVIEGSMILGVEISTVLENVTSQPMIGEQLIALEHIDQQLANQLWAKASGQRRAVKGMLAMARNLPAPDRMVVNKPELDFDKAKLRGRKLIEHYDELYPYGLTLVDTAGKTLVTLKFGALLELGALLPGGSATGIALDVLELLHQLHADTKGQSGWEQNAKRRAAMVRTGALSWAAEAKSSLGAVTRTTKVLAGRKVKTTFSPRLQHGQIGLNPLDPMAKRLVDKDTLEIITQLQEAVDTKNVRQFLALLPLVEGKVLDDTYGLCSRSPMISVFGGDIVLTFEAPIGMVLVKAYIWSAGNEGDGDGDPIAVLILRDAEMIKRIKGILKTSPFGPYGYRMAHSRYLVEQPYAKFYAENASKRIHGKTHTVTTISVSDYVKAAANTGKHYSLFMGKTFAICSYLTFMVGTQLETRGNVDPTLEKACVLAWRRLYEGMALSGLSNAAVEMQKHFGEIGAYNRIRITKTVADDLRGYGYDKVRTVKDKFGIKSWVEDVDALRYTWANINPNLDIDTAYWLHRAVLVTYAYSTIEREAGGDEYEFRSPVEVLAVEGREHLDDEDILREAITYGMIRRGSKGLAVAAPLGDEHGNGLFRFMRPEWVLAVGDGIVGEMVRAIWHVQKGSAHIRQALELAEANRQ